MLLPTTEQLAQNEAIDTLSASQVAARMLCGQRAAVDAVTQAVPEIEQGAAAMGDAIRSGHSLVYVAAGSSGLMALADACELPGTFGIPQASIKVHMAGGVPTDGYMPGDTEDDAKAAEDVVKSIAAGDAVIVVSASGTTPYAVAIAEYAGEKDATIIAIANNPATRLLDLADISICLATPPEVIAGSTRLGAGTAQKAALNLMSSLMAIDLGHVYQGLMVNVVADNAKLVKRAVGIVMSIAHVPQAEAEAALAKSSGDTKAAILIAAGCELDAAHSMLTLNGGHLGPCLQSIKPNQGKKAT